MKALQSSPTSDSEPFTEALSKLVSVSRVAVQKREANALKEAVSRHKRYKYIPVAKSSKA
jgi:hypothetical protein